VRFVGRGVIASVDRGLIGSGLRCHPAPGGEGARGSSDRSELCLEGVALGVLDRVDGEVALCLFGGGAEGADLDRSVEVLECDDHHGGGATGCYYTCPPTATAGQTATAAPSGDDNHHGGGGATGCYYACPATPAASATATAAEPVAVKRTADDRARACANGESSTAAHTAALRLAYADALTRAHAIAMHQAAGALTALINSRYHAVLDAAKRKAGTRAHQLALAAEAPLASKAAEEARKRAGD